MKKLLLFFAACLVGLASLAVTPLQKIEIEEETSGSRGPRSLTFSPEVTFSADQSMLEVRFFSTEQFVLKVVDAEGATVYVSSLITDGGAHSYFLSLPKSGTYSIVLESQSKTYRGTLVV